MIKKRFLCYIIALFISGHCFAQPIVGYEEDESTRFYFRAYGSYGFFTKTSFQLPASKTTTIGASTTEKFSTSNDGMGAGLRFGGGIGMVLSRYINVGVDAEYLMGTDLKSFTVETRSSKVELAPSPGAMPREFTDTTYSRTDVVLSHRILTLVPHVTFKAVSTERYYIYTRVGVLIGVPLNIQVDRNNKLTNRILYQNLNQLPENQRYSYDSSSVSTSYYRSKVGFGYQAALGVQLLLTDRINAFCEVVSNSLMLRPDKFEQTEKTSEVHSKYAFAPDRYSYDQSRDIVEFNNDGLSTAGGGIGPLEIRPQQAPKFTMAINSVNVAVGIVVRF